MQYNKIHYIAIQYNIVQYNIMQYIAMLHKTIQYIAIGYKAIHYNTLQCNFITLSITMLPPSSIYCNIKGWQSLWHCDMVITINFSITPLPPLSQHHVVTPIIHNVFPLYFNITQSLLSFQYYTFTTISVISSCFNSVFRIPYFYPMDLKMPSISATCLEIMHDYDVTRVVP